MGLGIDFSTEDTRGAEGRAEGHLGVTGLQFFSARTWNGEASLRDACFAVCCLHSLLICKGCQYGSQR